MKHVNHSPRLLSAIDDILSAYPNGVTEYDLMVLLDQQEDSLFPKPNLSDKILLFQHHFMLRHCLYQLQTKYAHQGQYFLDLSLTRIVRKPSSDGEQHLKEYDSLRDYYLDLNNLNKESAASIDAMLDSFWKRLVRVKAAPEAHQTLGLTGQESFKEKQQQYRKLAQQHHPDKGGDAETFQNIQSAWESINKSKS
ncbi:DNA-J related domain-containing protein [Reinekea marina]|uniref:DNA-J related domain-containing protein n=1 Tax=Reinekea marina TaxID=1310421 RepID=A0ABV7WM67_9GAMM|nr:DNA-J related domain-containing protein [Reinekea marina]MDN3649894.1 DNA-J related domain-containing protein [Reinekea marina]